VTGPLADQYLPIGQEGHRPRVFQALGQRFHAEDVIGRIEDLLTIGAGATARQQQGDNKEGRSAQQHDDIHKISVSSVVEHIQPIQAKLVWFAYMPLTGRSGSAANARGWFEKVSYACPRLLRFIGRRLCWSLCSHFQSLLASVT
jgi:hypothetical protein